MDSYRSKVTVLRSGVFVDKVLFVYFNYDFVLIIFVLEPVVVPMFGGDRGIPKIFWILPTHCKFFVFRKFYVF